MNPNKITLREIERSIAINCTIDYKSYKPLQLAKWVNGVTNQGIGRSLFLYIALNSGYNKEQICDYLNMPDVEYDLKATQLADYYETGKLLYETVGVAAGYLDTKDAHLFFYRKLVLAQNYLRYRFGL